jgi:hypothetical protein
MTPAQKKLKLGNKTKAATKRERQKRSAIERSLHAAAQSDIDTLNKELQNLRQKKN